MRTLKGKMNMLLLHESFSLISSNYTKGVPSDLCNNTIKLLLRCKKMCEAKSSVEKILKLILKRENLKD